MAIAWIRCFATISCIITLNACANNEVGQRWVDNPSMVNQQKLQMAQAPVTLRIWGALPATSDLQLLSTDFKKRGVGDVSVQRTANTPLATSRNVQTQLQAAGVPAQRIKINPDILPPQTENGRALQAVISYKAWQVLPPAGCTQAHVPDVVGLGDLSTNSDYKMGCMRDQFLGAMVAHPADLLGNDANTKATSQRLGKALDTYNKGEPLTPSGASISTGAITQGGQ